MIFGIGVDVLEVKRITGTLERFGSRFIDHLLMPQEREQLARTQRPARFIAMRFAAKEAIVKAMVRASRTVCGSGTSRRTELLGKAGGRVLRARRKSAAWPGCWRRTRDTDRRGGLVVAVAVLMKAGS